MATIASPTPTAAPVEGADGAAPAARRIEALDFVRGVALCGILLMNITGFGLPDAYTNPVNAGGATGANLWAWIVTEIGFEGTQRALFSMLFGASAILLLSRLEAAGRPDAADIYVRRNLWLVGFGMVNAFLFLWYGDILYAYGIVALFIFPFRKMAARWLLAIGLGALLLGAAWTARETHELLGKHEAFAAASAARAQGARPSPAQQAATAAWEEARAEFKSTPEDIADAVKARTSGYAAAFIAHRAHQRLVPDLGPLPLLLRHIRNDADRHGAVPHGRADARPAGAGSMWRWPGWATASASRSTSVETRLDHRPPVQRGLIRAGASQLRRSAGWR